MKTRRVVAWVVAGDEAGYVGNFTLKHHLRRKVASEDEARAQLDGYEFRARTSPEEVRVVKVRQIVKIELLAEEIFLSVSPECDERAKATVQLGDYDDPKDLNPDWRISPLTNQLVDFDMDVGEGIEFNKEPIGNYDYQIVRRKGYFIITGMGEQWLFPCDEWQRDATKQGSIEYIPNEQMLQALISDL